MPLSRRRPRRRTPSGSSSRHDDAGPVLRALAASVYAPTAVFAVGSGAIQPVLVLAAMDVGMSRPAAALVIGLLGVVGVVSAPVAEASSHAWEAGGPWPPARSWRSSRPSASSLR